MQAQTTQMPTTYAPPGQFHPAVVPQPTHIQVHPQPVTPINVQPAPQPAAPLTLYGYPTYADYESSLLSMTRPLKSVSKPQPGQENGVDFVSSQFKYDHSRRGAGKEFSMELSPLFTPKGIQRSDKYNRPSWYIMVVMNEEVPMDPDTTVTQQQVATNIKTMNTLSQLRQDAAKWLDQYKYDWGAGQKSYTTILEGVPEFATHPPMSKEDKRPDPNKPKTMFLKLANKVGAKGVYKTRFYTPKSKECPGREIQWEELENVSFTLIPLVNFNGMYLSGKSIFQAEVKSAIVLPGIKIIQMRSSQQDTLNKLEEEHPEYADQASSDLARLAALNQSRLALVKPPVEEPDSGEERSTFPAALTAHKNLPKPEINLPAPLPGIGVDGLPPLVPGPIVPGAVFANPGVGVPIMQDTRLG